MKNIFNEQFPDAEVLFGESCLYSRIKDKVSASSDLSVLVYNNSKLPQCLHTTSRIGKSKWALVYKVVGLSLIY